jgi:hypothetical protein
MILKRSCLIATLWCLVWLGAVERAEAGDGTAHFEATLVWGTNDPQPDNPSLKPVPAAVAGKLSKLPFKWKYYYSVDAQQFSVEEGKRQKVRMSKDCEIVVKVIDREKVQLALRGEGQPVGTVTQKLCTGDMLVTGGNAENYTAWFVVLRRIEPRSP